MPDSLTFFRELPEHLYTLISLGLIVIGTAFLFAAIKNDAPDRIAKAIVSVLLLTIGLGGIAFLWGLPPQ